MGGEEGVGWAQQQGENHEDGDEAGDYMMKMMTIIYIPKWQRYVAISEAILSKPSDNRRDHETDARGFQQEVKRVGADQGGKA